MEYRPRVGAIEQERYEEDLESAKEDGLDIGDYKWIDDNLYHCPMVDWVKTGQVNPILKNQLKCGSCWAHSTVAAVENLYARYMDVAEAKDIPSLSE